MCGYEHQQALNTNPDRLTTVAVWLSDSVTVTLRAWDRIILVINEVYYKTRFYALSWLFTKIKLEKKSIKIYIKNHFDLLLHVSVYYSHQGDFIRALLNLYLD